MDQDVQLAPLQLAVLVESNAGVQVEAGREHDGVSGVVAIREKSEGVGDALGHADVLAERRELCGGITRNEGIMRDGRLDLGRLRNVLSRQSTAPELAAAIGEALVCWWKAWSVMEREKCLNQWLTQVDRGIDRSVELGGACTSQISMPRILLCSGAVGTPIDGVAAGEKVGRLAICLPGGIGKGMRRAKTYYLRHSIWEVSLLMPIQKPTIQEWVLVTAELGDGPLCLRVAGAPGAPETYEKGI